MHMLLVCDDKNILKELYIFKFRLWFFRMNKRNQIKSIVEFKACNMKGEGGRSYLKNVVIVLTLV